MLVCFYDKERNMLSKKILTDTEFKYLMNRRKIDNVWKTIYFIQQLIKKENNFKKIIHIEFDYDKDQNTPLYENAFNRINLMAMKQSNQKTLDFNVINIDDLRKEDVNKLC